MCEQQKKDVEGSLFVVRRNIEPMHRIIVMNRLNTNDFVEDVTPALEVQVSDPFLLYRNKQGEVNGIWFYSADERESVYKVLRR
jgi:mRNA-decapping enzyme 1B